MLRPPYKAKYCLKTDLPDPLEAPYEPHLVLVARVLQLVALDALGDVVTENLEMQI